MRESAGPGEVTLLLTAEEAFPAFERAVLGAQSRIVAGFRIFDPATRLLSGEGRAIGETWFDLLLHTLGRGVAIDLLLSDFDPVTSAELHRQTWHSLRQLWAIAELAGPGGRLTIRAGLHPSRVGLVPRTILWRRARGELNDMRDRLNALSPAQRRAQFRDMPRLQEWLSWKPDGRLSASNWGPTQLYPVTHHQKIAVIDGQYLYIGGLDLNPRRYDTKRHERPARETWHDVQVLARGPVAAEAEAHLAALPDVVRGRAPPPPASAALKTTLSARRTFDLPYISPRPVRADIDTAIKGQIAGARQAIYLETQFFRDRRLANVLCRAARLRPELSLLMVLPSAPEAVAFEGRRKLDQRFGEFLQALCVKRVRRAFGARAFLASPAQARSAEDDRPERRDRLLGAPIVYVHAKLCIFDARAALVSSANLNGRSLHWDTEAGLLVDDPVFAGHALDRALNHWLPGEVAERARHLPDLVATVRAQAEADAARAPEDRAGFLLPYDVRPAEAFGRDVPPIPEEIV